MVTPGIGTAEKVAELSWLYWVSALGSTPVSIETTVESGTLLAAPGLDEIMGQLLAASADRRAAPGG